MNSTDFAQRRQRLFELMEPNSLAIVPATAPKVRNQDVHYPYRPDSDFFYLTGFSESDAVAVFVPGRSKGAYLLFCQERDPKKELWDGPMIGLQGARRDYGADEAKPIDKLDQILPKLLQDCESLYFSFGLHPDFDQKLGRWIQQARRGARNGRYGPIRFHALDYHLHEQRLCKDQAELKQMRQAAQISAQAHRHLMQICRPGMSEADLAAEFIHQCALQGAPEQAYPPIVASGANSCILHYVANQARLEPGDLVLIDAGAEYQYYASDITRTFPVSGEFNPWQRQVYELVLAAQLAAIKKVKPGNHWNDPHNAAVRTLTHGLVELGLLKGKPATLIRQSAYKQFFPHRTGHWLGMDVHDVGQYRSERRWRLFEPGMVLTVEPGLYIPAKSKGVAKHWWNIGIRIEDDVLVTETGHEVLTATAPKTIAEIAEVQGQD